MLPRQGRLLKGLSCYSEKNLKIVPEYRANDSIVKEFSCLVNIGEKRGPMWEVYLEKEEVLE